MEEGRNGIRIPKETIVGGEGERRMQDTPCLTFGLQMAEYVQYVETKAPYQLA